MQIFNPTGYKDCIVRFFWVCLLIVFVGDVSYAESMGKVFAGRAESLEFNRVYELILKDAGIKYEMLVVPTGRKRRMFADGKILIDCCTVPDWRNRPEEIAVQLHSKPFFQSMERYVFHKDNKFDIVSHEDLSRYRLSIVRGYFYKNDAYFGDFIMAENTSQMMKMVAHKRVEIGIINPHDFQQLLKKTPMPLWLGGVHETSPLSIRVHKSRPDLLARIDGVIERYLAKGYVKEILAHVAGNETEKHAYESVN